MTETIDRTDPRHVYQQAADILRDRITSGVYKPGENIPSMLTMAQELEISELTMERAFKQLRDQGWLVIRHGYPTQVASDLPVPVRNPVRELKSQARELAQLAARLLQAVEELPEQRRSTS